PGAAAPMNFGSWVRRVAANSLAILLHPSRLGRFRLLTAYLRVEAKKKFLVEILKRRLTEETVFSQRIGFADYRTFVILFEEIYVGGGYFFRSEGAEPLIVDAGANIGMACAYFKTIYPGCRI